MKIKFRVWDKTEKCWLTYDDVFIEQEGDVYFIEERNWAYQSYMHKENITEKVEMNQYTGLKDKNGKEIYEGDVFIKVTTGSIFEVYYCENSACYRAKRTDGWHFDLKDLYPITDWKVIGNIYENELVQP